MKVMKNDISIGIPSNHPNRSITARTGMMTGSVTAYRKFSMGFSSSMGSQLKMARPNIRNWIAVMRYLTVAEITNKTWYNDILRVFAVRFLSRNCVLGTQTKPDRLPASVYICVYKVNAVFTAGLTYVIRAILS